MTDDQNETTSRRLTWRDLFGQRKTGSPPERYEQGRPIREILVSHISQAQTYDDPSAYLQRRPSYAETTALQTRIAAEVGSMTDDAIHDFCRSALPRLLEAVGSFRIPHADIPTLYFLLKTLSDEKQRRYVPKPDLGRTKTREEIQEEIYQVLSSPEPSADSNSFDYKKLGYAATLVDNVAGSEYLFGPLIPDTNSPPPAPVLTSRTTNLDSFVRSVQFVPDFALYGPNTRSIYENLGKRILQGYPSVEITAFPTEPSDELLAKKAIRTAYDHKRSDPLKTLDIVALPLEAKAWTIVEIDNENGTARIKGKENEGNEWVTKTVPLRWLYNPNVAIDFAGQLGLRRMLHRVGLGDDLGQFLELNQLLSGPWS